MHSTDEKKHDPSPPSCSCGAGLSRPRHAQCTSRNSALTSHVARVVVMDPCHGVALRASERRVRVPARLQLAHDSERRRRHRTARQPPRLGSRRHNGAVARRGSSDAPRGAASASPTCSMRSVPRRASTLEEIRRKKRPPGIKPAFLCRLGPYVTKDELESIYQKNESVTRIFEKMLLFLFFSGKMS